jgi:hypothetical protein
VCLHNDLSKKPFARLPKSWINKSDGWAEVIKQLRDKEDIKDEAAGRSTTLRQQDATQRSTTLVFPSDLSTFAAMHSVSQVSRVAFRELVRLARSALLSVFSSRERSPGHRSPKDSASTRGVLFKLSGRVIAELTYEPVPVPVEFIPLLSVEDSASARGNDTSYQQSDTLVEAITNPTDEPVPVPAQITLPAKAIELDLLDCDAIPTLIAGVLRGTNVNEFLERLDVLAFMGK